MPAAFARIYEIIVWKDAIRVYDVPIRDLIPKLNLFSSWRLGKKIIKFASGTALGRAWEKRKEKTGEKTRNGRKHL